MTKYTSKYAELSFYVGGIERKFSAGIYEAKTADEIVVLDRLTDALKITEEPQVVADKPADITPTKPAAKPRKANAPSSAK